MKRRVLLYAFMAAIAGIGCSVLVSYDGYGDGVRGDDGGGTDGTIGADGDTTNEGGGGDSSVEGGDDAGGDASDGGPDGTTNKKHAVVLLGGNVYNEAGVGGSIANVEYAIINADGTLGPWMPTTSMTDTEDAVGAATWGSSIFIMDDFGTRVAVMQADGGLSSWTTLASVNRNSPRLAAVDGRLYVAGGTAPGGAAAPEVYYAAITGPLSIGTWTPTTALSTIDGGPRNDTNLLVNDRTLYLVGGDHANVDIESVLSAPIDGTGAVGQWKENTPLPSVGDHLRAEFSQGHLTIVGGSFDLVADRNVYTSAVQDGGVLSSWQMGTQHPDTDEPTFFVFANFAYLIGGHTGTKDLDTVYYAPLQSNGLPGGWVTTSAIKLPRHDATAVVVEMP